MLGFEFPESCPPLGTQGNLKLNLSSAEGSPGWAGVKCLVVLILYIYIHSDPPEDALEDWVPLD